MECRLCNWPQDYYISDTAVVTNENRHHRVDRVLTFSSVFRTGTPPPPHPQASVFPTSLVRGGGGGNKLACGRGSGGANSDEGQYVLSGRHVFGIDLGNNVEITFLLISRIIRNPIIHCKDKIPKNFKQIFPEKEYRGLSPNFHIHVSVSELYIPMMGLPFLL